MIRHAVISGRDRAALDVAIRDLLEGTGSHPFHPYRVLLQDASGVPALLDIAALRDAALRVGRDPETITPVCPVDLVVDHSIRAEKTGHGSDRYNLTIEYEENAERFGFLRWAEGAFDRLSVFPPGNGIVHQINLERLTSGVVAQNGWIFPETLVGADSHTPMANGLGVLGWGVGGIEATAVMLGHPVDLLLPPVVGLELRGKPRPGLMTMDIALALAKRLRDFGVVGSCLEVFGSGLEHLSVEERATIANMTPEYGSTATLFPLDDMALRYLAATGRSEAAALAGWFLSRMPLLDKANDVNRRYARTLSIDLGAIMPAVAGPSLPHQCNPISNGFSTTRGEQSDILSDGDVVMAAITSCTNTSNPRAMIAAGLLARNAVESGLSVSPRIKTSLSPGSRMVSAYLRRLDLLSPLEKLGFAISGFGCMTCVGNSGELPDNVAKEIRTRKVNVAAILSGNRNFQGRIHPLIRSSYLASPPLVIAYALAGRMDIDLGSEPLATGSHGPVRLADIWPSDSEIEDALKQAAASLSKPSAPVREEWDALPAATGACFPWPSESNYLVEPRFSSSENRGAVLEGARALLLLGDNVTTDHISPVGRIAADSPAGRMLTHLGIPESRFNTYGARRGNAPLMRLGTFANPNVPNRLAGDRPGNWTRHHPSGAFMPIPDAASLYAADETPLIIVAGKQYGIGSARDWAAKGTRELGIAAVLAESFERIHRANLALVGVLPLQWDRPIELAGDEIFHIETAASDLFPGMPLQLRIETPSGSKTVSVICRLDTLNEVALWRGGGFLAQALARDPAEVVRGRAGL
ncbi:aconitase [Mesorhizobium australicum]|uniref:Aconitate hydratase A n=1 Tax=Mesorhizobium australicum TaxID=536018 RepID=A0A1X7MTU1_9HYPH|nr:aconitase [Mesorhizobium australicum]